MHWADIMPWVDIMTDKGTHRIDCLLDSFNHVSSEEELEDMAFGIAVERGLVGRDDRLQVVLLVWPPLSIRQAWGWPW
jgi:hypothetical protein